MSAATELLQTKYLEALFKDAIPVSIYLINGIKLTGLIADFDGSAILLKDAHSKINQLVYKHAISTIVPNKAIEQHSLAPNAIVN